MFYLADIELGEEVIPKMTVVNCLIGTGVKLIVY